MRSGIKHMRKQNKPKNMIPTLQLLRMPTAKFVLPELHIYW